MKIIRLFLSLALLTALAASCEKNDNAQPTKQLEGEWILRDVSGGIHGQGYTPDFDQLNLKDGKYALVKGAVSFSSGDFVYNTEIEHGLLFHQKQHKEGFAQFVDQPKKVDISKENVLILADPCCDLFTYRFTRKGVDVE